MVRVAAIEINQGEFFRMVTVGRTVEFMNGTSHRTTNWRSSNAIKSFYEL